MDQWQIGSVRVTKVIERAVTIPPEGLLPGLTPQVIDGLGGWADPYFTDDHQMHLSIHSFVVETPEHVVVVDTCVGAHTEQMLPGDPEFADRLEAVLPGGFDAVDVVVCTHLHFDHVGWNTRLIDGELVPSFPNARYVVSGAELEGTQADDHMGVMEPSVQPLLDAGLLDAVSADHRIDSSVRLVPSAGHSPGHVCVEISSDGETALITGDAFHSAAQIARPDIASNADFDQAASTATRRQILTDLADGPTVVLGTHFPPPTAGRVRSGPDHHRFLPIEGAS